MQSTDTIAAIATPPGSGAIAVIRMSGPQATAVLQACIGKQTEPRRATLAYVRDAQGRVVDEVVVTYFAAPASYTGEDVAELSCHGGMLVTRRVLERLLQCGARPAEPGEFTRRAFENGKMELTQAEAVMDINAPEGPVTVAIRPEGFEPDAEGCFSCTLRRVEVMGRDVSVVCEHNCFTGETFRAIIDSDNLSGLNGQTVRFRLKENKVFLFDPENGKRIPLK